MRKAFFFLLVVNLVFLAWQYYQHRAPLETHSQEPDEDGIPSLVLLRERADQSLAGESEQDIAPQDTNTSPRMEVSQEALDPGAKQTPDQMEAQTSETDVARSAPEAAPLTEPVVPPRSCRTLGPIADQAQAEALVAALVDLRVQAWWREVQPREVDSYWVLAPPGETRAETRRIVAKLKERGVQDLWIMLRGELKGYISLGIYTRESRARQRQRQLAAYGVEAILRPRFTELPQYWVDLETQAGPQEEDELLENIRGLQPGLVLAPVDCSELNED